MKPGIAALAIGVTLVVLTVLALSVDDWSLGTGRSDVDDEGVYELVIELRADENAPSGFGFAPGKALEGARVNVELLGGGSVQPASLSGITDDVGRLTLMVDGGSYDIFVAADTPDPLCVWLGSTAVTVSASPTTVTLDDLWVACQ